MGVKAYTCATAGIEHFHDWWPEGKQPPRGARCPSEGCNSRIRMLEMPDVLWLVSYDGMLADGSSMRITSPPHKSWPAALRYIEAINAMGPGHVRNIITTTYRMETA
jgi:hypothetical protein